MSHFQSGAFNRRVYRREFREALGWGETWFRAKVKSGAIPSGKRDPGGKREFWLASEVEKALARLNRGAEPSAAARRSSSSTGGRARA